VGDSTGLRFELTPDKRTQQRLSGWRGRPAHTIRYSVNVEGHRGALVSHPKPDGEYRIVVIGDSFVFGSLVDDDETFPFQLERALDDPRVRVVNLGVPGFQIRQTLATLELRVPSFEPDLVLMNLFLNDAMPTPMTFDERVEETDAPPESSALRWVKRLGLTGGAWDAGELTPAQRWSQALRHRSALADLFADRLYRRLFASHNLSAHVHRWRPEGEGWARILAALDRAAALSDERGFELHVSFYPMLIALDDYPLAGVHERLAAACAERGVVFHDLLEPLAGRDAQTLWAHERDHHPNARCNALVAEHLARSLEPRVASLRDRR
jgi:hypothetical protein